MRSPPILLSNSSTIGTLIIPGDKSISHRAVIFAALSNGVTRLSHFLKSEDCLYTLKALQALGVISWWDKKDLLIQGVGIHFKAPLHPLYFGNSGTGLRLMAGLLVGQPFNSVLIGDASLSQRPMDRIIDPLRAMGAKITGMPFNNQTVCPLRIQGGQCLKAIDYTLPIPSAQVKSCLLLASRFAQGHTRIYESQPTRDHTERLLVQFKNTGKGPLTACHLTIPGDMSSAAFFMVAATLMPNFSLTLPFIGVNPTRMGVIHILRLMGANIKVKAHAKKMWEPMADIHIYNAPLKGIVIPDAHIVSAMDEFPILFIAAAFAKGETVLHGALELRVKESDRLTTMADNLTKLGFLVKQYSDGIKIQGFESFRPPNDLIVLDSKGDHRIAMAFSIAVCILKNTHPHLKIIIQDTECIKTSFPDFQALLAQLMKHPP